MSELTIPEIVPYFLAILGLLLLWEMHSIQVSAGRIKSVDIWSRSGIRLFLHATPDDTETCPSCKDANGTAFLPAMAAKKNFSPLATPCTNPGGCRCIQVGLYGSWPQALRLQAKLQHQGTKTKLSGKELDELIEGSRAQKAGGISDQIQIAFLKALRAEGTDLNLASQQYRLVIEKAKSDRELPYVVPAYLRLTALLERSGQKDQALKVVDQFLAAYSGKGKEPHSPTEDQVALQSLRKSRLSATPT